MRIFEQTLCVVFLVMLSSCGPLHEQQASMPPDPGETLPEWAFDAPFYFRPPPDVAPKPASELTADYSAHYYVSKRVILLDRPTNQVPVDRVPRIGVWWTNTDGGVWTRAGFFGLGQTHFSLVAGDDGDYGVRFAGPGIRESLTGKTLPHRVYHLDTQAPLVTVCVEPDKPIYEPNESILIHWWAVDPHLYGKPVRVAVCWSWENPGIFGNRGAEFENSQSAEQEEYTNRIWQPFENALDSSGILAYTIPDYAAGEGMQFQVRAKDRCGNYGVGYSKLVWVSGYTELPTDGLPSQKPGPIASGYTTSTPPTTQPASQ